MTFSNRLATFVRHWIVPWFFCVAFATSARADIDCVIEPGDVSDVGTAVRGVISSIEVKRGDWVEKGQVVATIESSVERAAVTLAKARAEAEQAIRAQRTRLQLADKRLRRIRALGENVSVASQDLDEAEAEQMLAKIELDRAIQENYLAKLEVMHAQVILDLRTVRSPLTGIVVKIYSATGELTENKPIMQIAQIDPLHVEAVAPVESFGKLHVGDVLQVLPEQPVGGQFDAKVSMVEQIVEARSGTFGIQLLLPNKERELPAGLRCKIRWDGEGVGSVEPSTRAVLNPVFAIGGSTTVEAGDALNVREIAVPTGEAAEDMAVQADIAPARVENLPGDEDSRPDAPGFADTETAPAVKRREGAASLLPAVTEAADTAVVDTSVTTPLAPTAEESGINQAESIIVGETLAESEIVDGQPEPSLAPEIRDEINGLLSQIRENIERDRLSRPVHDNAVDKINQIFALDPDNQFAKSALNDVVDRYIVLAKENRGALGKAYLRKARRLLPERLDIDDTWRALYAPGLPDWHEER